MLCQLHINVVANPLFLPFLWYYDKIPISMFVFLSSSVSAGLYDLQPRWEIEEKTPQNTFILSTNWFAQCCLLLADGTDSKGFVLLFLLLAAERTDWLCPKFSLSSLSMSSSPGSFSNLRNWRQRDLGPMFSYIFCCFKWFFGTAEYNCLGIDSQCKLAKSLWVLRSHANLHSREFDTISAKGA